MTLGKEHQGRKEGNILTVLRLTNCQEVEYGKYTDHVKTDRMSQKRSCITTALTRSRDNYGGLERLYRKRECLGQALKEE